MCRPNPIIVDEFLVFSPDQHIRHICSPYMPQATLALAYWNGVMNIDIRFANRFSLQKKCSWCAFFCIWLCGIPFVLSNQTTLCPYGHFRVGLEHASYEVNQNVQVVLVKLADRQSFNTRAESLRICAGCKSCACQKVVWASGNSSKFQPKVFPLLQWFDTFRTTVQEMFFF